MFCVGVAKGIDMFFVFSARGVQRVFCPPNPCPPFQKHAPTCSALLLLLGLSFCSLAPLVGLLRTQQ